MTGSWHGGKGSRIRPFDQRKWEKGYERAFKMTESGAMKQLLAVYEAATTDKALISNQGQALDGYSELANYRAILAAFLKSKESDNDSTATRQW